MKKGGSFPWWILIVGFLLFRWGGRIIEHPERAPLVLIALLSIVAAVLLALWLMKLWMQSTLKKLQNADFVPIDLAQFAAGMPAPNVGAPMPNVANVTAPSVAPPPLLEAITPHRAPTLPLSLAMIEHWTQKLAELGFEWRLDYTLDGQAQKTAPGKGVCRLLFLPDENIYACIRQTIMNGQALPIRPALYSFLENGGEVITIGAPAQDHNMATHRPSDVLDFRPEATAPQLLEQHRTRRTQVQQFLEQKFRPETSTEWYLNYERSGAKRLLDGYGKTNVFQLLKILLTMNSTSTLLGNLGAHVKN